MRLILICALLLLFQDITISQDQNFKEKAEKIHKSVLTVDSHTDTPMWFTRDNFDLSKKHDARETRSRVDFPRMKEGGLDAVFMAAFIGQGKRDDNGNKKAKERIIRIFNSIDSHINRHPDLAGIALSPDDAYKLEEQGKRAIFIGIENAYPVGNDLDNIRIFYERGARYITLCHTRTNDICDSSTDTLEHGGLSKFGKKVVKEMNRTGMMIDVSHISDDSFYDVIKISKAPVIASHSCARAICNSPRNLTDDMLKVLAKNGGVIQVCVLSAYVKEPKPNPERDSAFSALRKKYRKFNNLSDEQRRLATQEWRNIDKEFPSVLATVADFVDHIDHIVKVAGIDHVGVGTDFDGGGGLADCFDVSQMGNITYELVKRGYSEEEIRKIWGGNLMRVFREVTELKK